MKAKLWLPGFMLFVSLTTAPLPALVSGSIGMGAYLWRVVWPMALIYGLVKLALRLPQWLRGSSLEEVADTLLPRVPLFGPMHVRRNARDFFESLALMLEAGIPMLDALPPAIDTITNSQLRRQFEVLHELVAGGATFAQALQMVPQVGDARVLAFAQTGEASGTLPEMLFRHVDMESAALGQFHAQLAVWIPRVVYAVIALWVGYGLIAGGAMSPKLPPELQ
jgi:general secretion pathway protein F